MSYTLLRLPRAERQLTSLKKAHNQFVAAILRAIEGLGRDPRPPGVEKLVGRPNGEFASAITALSTISTIPVAP